MARGARRRTRWVGQATDGSVPTGSSITGTLIHAGLNGETVIRTLIDFVWSPSTEPPNMELMACGIVVVRDEAVGTSTVPDPRDDLNAGWLWHWFGHITQVVGGDDAPPRILRDDIRAMRKLDDEHSLVMCIRNAGAITTEFGWAVRHLIAV